MSNAAISLHPNGFDTTGAALLGRHAAGESFLRGFLRHADVDTFPKGRRNYMERGLISLARFDVVEIRCAD